MDILSSIFSLLNNAQPHGFNEAIQPARTTYSRTLGVDNSTKKIDSLIEQINRIREENKLPPLTQDDRLNVSASQKAQDLTKRNYWSHQDPDGNMTWDTIKKAGYNYEFAGENLANKYDDASSLEEWLKSPTHRANILDKDFTNIGIGRDGNYNVLHFGKEF